MGRGCNRLTPKVRRKKAQRRLKARIRKHADATKAERKGAPKAAARPAGSSAEATTIRRGSET